MSSPFRRAAVAGLVASVVIAAAALPADAKPKAFKPVFAAKFPGEPKAATAFSAAVKLPIGAATGFVYNDAVGSLTLNGLKAKAGLTTIQATLNVNVAAGMDLTDVTFPVTRECLVVYSYTRTTIKLSDPTNPKIVAYDYSSDTVTPTTVTVTSYDPVKGELKGTLQGDVVFHQNIQDPSDDARDGKIVHMKNAKFALRALAN